MRNNVEKRLGILPAERGWERMTAQEQHEGRAHPTLVTAMGQRQQGRESDVQRAVPVRGGACGGE